MRAILPDGTHLAPWTNSDDCSSYGCGGDHPSLSVFKKATMAPSSSTVSPRLPTSVRLTFSDTSGAGQQLTPGSSPMASGSEQVGSTSLVL